MTRRSRKTRTTYGVRALRSERGYAVQSLASRRLLELPLVRQPSIQFAQLRLRQVHQQLREIQLRINLVPAAGAGQASQNCECATATRVADKKGILPVQHDAFHLTLTYIVIDGNRAIRAENVQLRPVIQSVVHRIGHGMLRDQLLLPNQQLLPQFGQHGHRLLLTNLQALGGRSFPGLVLYGEEGTQQGHDLTRDFRCRFFRIDNLSSRVTLILITR